jgi:hypothetical protein
LVSRDLAWREPRLQSRYLLSRKISLVFFEKKNSANFFTPDPQGPQVGDPNPGGNTNTGANGDLTLDNVIGGGATFYNVTTGNIGSSSEELDVTNPMDG